MGGDPKAHTTHQYIIVGHLCGGGAGPPNRASIAVSSGGKGGKEGGGGGTVIASLTIQNIVNGTCTLALKWYMV